MDFLKKKFFEHLDATVGQRFARAVYAGLPRLCVIDEIFAIIGVRHTATDCLLEERDSIAPRGSLMLIMDINEE